MSQQTPSLLAAAADPTPAPEPTPAPAPAAAASPTARPPQRTFSPEEDESFTAIQRDVRNFDEYERQFQEILMSLESDDVLDAFLSEYSGLHHSFLKSHQGEGRLLRKCLDLQSDIYTSAAKAQAAAELSREDRGTIEVLTLEVDRTRKKITTTREKEAQLREKVDKLKLELAEVERIARTPVEAAAQEAALLGLMRVHESVLKEKESLEFRASTTQHDIAATERRLARLMEGKTANDAELQVVRDAIATTQLKADAVLELKSKREEQLRVARNDLAKRSALVIARAQKIECLREDGTRHHADTRAVAEETEALQEQYQVLCRQVNHANTALQDCNEDNDTLQRKVREAAAALQEQQATIVASHRRYLKEAKVAEALQRRNVVMDQRRAEAEQKRDALRDECRQLEATLAAARSGALSDEKELALVHREQDLLFQANLDAEGEAHRNRLWLAEKQNQLRHAEHSVMASEEHAEQQKQAVFKTSEECLTYEAQSKKYALQCATMMGEVQASEAHIAETQAAITEAEAKLRQQQELLDGLTVTRNAYAKHYGDLRHDLAEMNKSFQLILGQIVGVKDDIVRRERDLLAEDATTAGLVRQRKDLEVHILGLQRRAEKRGRAVDIFNGELRKLADVLAAAQGEVDRQRRRCLDIAHERDLLDRQAAQREREVTEHYEKAHTQQALLQRGEELYRDRAGHIAQLEHQTVQLGQRLSQMQAFVSRLPDLRLMINNAGRGLNRERVRVAALLATAAQPLNVHPAHALAWSAPETYALTAKARELQRELADQRRLLAETERLIQATEAGYLKAKATVARQPGPEVAEQLSAYQEGLVKKQGQMRQMLASLQYFREQTEAYSGRHEELRGRLSDMAREYAAQREEEDKRQRPKAGTITTNNSSGDGARGGAGPFVYAGFVAPPMAAE